MLPNLLVHISMLPVCGGSVPFDGSKPEKRLTGCVPISSRYRPVKAEHKITPKNLPKDPARVPTREVRVVPSREQERKAAAGEVKREALAVERSRRTGRGSG